MLRFRYDCVGCPKLKELNHIIDNARTITYATFRKYADMDYVRDFNAAVGIPIHEDFHVSFSKSKTPGGKPVYFFTHSAIEHVFY